MIIPPERPVNPPTEKPPWNRTKENALRGKSKILFLDDDPERCQAFRLREPTATIVINAADCIDRLGAQSWGECHLDHDLMETYQDSRDANCGMEVVRWVLCAKPDVRTFVVHTHNEFAAPTMVAALESAGYRVLRVPFSFNP